MPPNAIRGHNKVRLGKCLTPYQRLGLYYGAHFSRLLRHAWDPREDAGGLSREYVLRKCNCIIGGWPPARTRRKCP